jgi:hypothetical protein
LNVDRVVPTCAYRTVLEDRTRIGEHRVAAALHGVLANVANRIPAGVTHCTPIHRDRGLGGCGLVLENNAMLLKAALKAEMDHLENQARDTVDPAERQQLLRRFCEKRTEYFSV